MKVVVPFAAGSSPDIVARLLGQWLSTRFGQQFIVDNRPGAGTNVGTEAVVRAAPDGYTLLWATTPNAINATFYDKLNFNFIRDIAPVAGLFRQPHVMVANPSVPAQTVSELLAYAKANPDKINVASAGNGTMDHLSGELFKMMTGIRMVHVPYRGGGASLYSDLLAGQVQLNFPAVAGSIGYIRAGKLRPLALTTALRWEGLADVPALGEFVPGYEASSWHGIGAPKNTPAEIVDMLNREINAALADPGMKTRFSDLAGTELTGTPAAFGKLVADDTEKWAKVIRAANIKAE